MTQTYDTDHDAIDEAIDVLNRIHAADPIVLQTLIDYRVPCNDAVANDPTVQVGIGKDPTVPDNGTWVGLLGIINGLFGTNNNGAGFIFANYDDDRNLVGFGRNE